MANFENLLDAMRNAPGKEADAPKPRKLESPIKEPETPSFLVWEGQGGLVKHLLDYPCHTITHEAIDEVLNKQEEAFKLAWFGVYGSKPCIMLFEHSKFLDLLRRIGVRTLQTLDVPRNEAALQKLCAKLPDSGYWQDTFHRLDELPEGDIIMLIDKILPEGITFLGAGSGVGKTWVALSMARALTNGTPFMNVFHVPEPRNVIYLVPENGAKAFRRRAAIMGINPERFWCQTMNDGIPISLHDPILASAIRDLKHPVIFLDTAIRFQTSSDENSATESAQGLAKGIFNLIQLGAIAVVGLHHATKEAAKSKESLTLETCLRGSGDIGAMCDCVWGLQNDTGGDGEGEPYLKQSQDLTRLFLRCVKPRDLDPKPADFRIQGRSENGESYFVTDGDFHVLATDVISAHQRKVQEVSDYIKMHEDGSKKEISKECEVSKDAVDDYAKEAGWVCIGASAGKAGKWQRIEM